MRRLHGLNCFLFRVGENSSLVPHTALHFSSFRRGFVFWACVCAPYIPDTHLQGGADEGAVVGLHAALLLASHVHGGVLFQGEDRGTEEG